MFNTQIVGAAFLTLLVLLPALALFHHPLKFQRFAGVLSAFKPFGDIQPKPFMGVRPFLRLLWRSEVGAVTVTYYARGAGITINGSTVNPTTTQGSLLQKVAATVAFGATGDAQALFTHNMGLDASAPGYWEPEILWEAQTTNTYAPLITFDRTNTNVLKVNKPATDAPATLLVTIRRPGGPWA